MYGSSTKVGYSLFAAILHIFAFLLGIPTFFFLNMSLVLWDGSWHSSILMFIVNLVFVLALFFSLAGAFTIIFRLRYRWILLFSIIAFLGSGPAFLSLTCTSVLSGIALILVLMWHDELSFHGADEHSRGSVRGPPDDDDEDWLV